jgi:hypothetical protein
MALTDGEGGGIPATMLVGPTGYGNNGSGCGFGNGQDGWWIVLLIILLAAGNGFGNNGNGGGFGGQPIIVNDGVNSGSVQRGFDQAAVMSGVNGVQAGINNLSTQLCGCCGDMQMAIANGFAGVEMGANARQIADMQQNFASQTAITGAITNLAAQQANCCCENRLATCQTQNIIQNEGNQTRFADANNTRDIIQSQTAGTQAILDKLCQLELDGVKAQVDAKNDRIAELQTQLNMATLRESQTAQNAFISQGFANEVDQLYNRLNNCPVPTTPVYGRTPIFTCNQNNGCGCGCNNAF